MAATHHETNSSRTRIWQSDPGFDIESLQKLKHRLDQIADVLNMLPNTTNDRYRLIWRDPTDSTTHAFDLGGDQNLIGRSGECDLQLALNDVSRRHFRITLQDDTYQLEDLSSANGTFVNGRAAKRPVTLHAGDAIGVGSVTLYFLDPLILN